MKSIQVVAALVLSFAGLSARAARMTDPSGWCQVAGPDFTVVSQMNRADTADWAGRLGQFLGAIKGKVPGDPRVLGPFTLVLFDRRSDFFDAAPVLKNGDPFQNLGSFSRSGGWGAIVATCDRGSTQDTQRLIFGAGVDWLLSADHRFRPRALSTGLIEVFGAYAVENGRQIFGRPVYGWTTFLQRGVDHPLGTSQRFLSIEELLSVADLNPVADRHGLSMFTVESWGFAHFLLFAKDMARQHAMDRLLDAFARHATPHEALAQVFGDGAATLNSRFHDYIRGGDFYEIASPVEQVPAMAPPAPADPAFVAATLGTLEASVGRLEDARSYAEDAIRLAPEDPRARDALALTDYIGGRHAEAAAACREAIRLKTRDGWTWYEASDEIGRTGDEPAAKVHPSHLTPAQAREAINDAEKAIIHCKGLQVAYHKVGALLPVADHVTEDDGKFLVFGRRLFPDDAWIEIGHAEWARRVHADALALKIIDDVLAHAATLSPAETGQARALRREWSAPGPG